VDPDPKLFAGAGSVIINFGSGSDKHQSTSFLKVIFSKKLNIGTYLIYFRSKFFTFYLENFILAPTECLRIQNLANNDFYKNLKIKTCAAVL